MDVAPETALLVVLGAWRSAALVGDTGVAGFGFLVR